MPWPLPSIGRQYGLRTTTDRRSHEFRNRTGVVVVIRAHSHEKAHERDRIYRLGWMAYRGLMRRRWVITVLAVAVAASLGGYALARTPSTPTGSLNGQAALAPPPGWGKLNAEAMARVWHQDGACQPHRLTDASLFRHDAPGKDLTSVFGALRRPAPASQRVSARALLRSPQQLDQFAGGIYLRYVRHGQRNGITYYLIPAANVNQVRPVPDRCYREQLDSFRQLADQRGALIRYEISVLQEKRMIAQNPAGVCLATASPAGSGTGPCVNAISLRQFNGRLGVGSDGNDHATVTPLIVPDRVATVTAHYSPQTYPGRVPRPLTVTEHAVQNLVIFYLHGAWDPPSSLIYRSATSSVLWSTTRP